jgi:choline kinase
VKCVILAAGSATRMRPLTNDRPKCLLPVEGKPILQRIIENVGAAGIDQIGLVVGYKADSVRTFVKQLFPFLHIRFVVNPKYETTNNAFSLLMAREYFVGTKGSNAPGRELLLLDADLVFSPRLLPFLLSGASPNKIAVRVAGTHDEEEVRVEVDAAQNILRVGKSIPLSQTYGESVGIEIFSPSAAQRLFEILEPRVRAGHGRTEYYEAAFQAMIDEGIQLKAVDVSSFPSVEVDTPEDLRLAERLAREQTGISSS